MKLKKCLKSLKSQKGQAALEYFIILCAIGAVILTLGLPVFLKNVQTSSQDYYVKQFARVQNADAKPSAAMIFDGLLAAFYIIP